MEAQALLLEKPDADDYRLPRLGSGVYAFSGYSARSKRYRLWYIGRSEDIGGRYIAHLKQEYLNPGSGLWLPLDPVSFLDGPQEYVSPETMGTESDGFQRANRKEIARQLVRDSHFCFALASPDQLVEVEAALHRIMWARFHGMIRGWLGDFNVPEVSDGFAIGNKYWDDQIAGFLRDTIGQGATFRDGQAVLES